MKKVLLFLLCVLHWHGLSSDAANHLISWGSTHYGLATVPEFVGDVVQIAAGGEHALVLTSGGSVFAWGNNMSGQADVPPDLVGVTAVAAGANHSLALLADGSVRAWGDGAYVPADLRARAIAGGGTFSAVIQTNGTLAVWGFMGGDLTQPPEFTNLISIAAGESHIVAQRADGQVLVWGGHPPMPAPEEATNVTALAAGSVHNLALRADGSVLAWGVDSHGQLQVPPNLAPAIAIAAGGYRSVAVLNDGSVVEWGDTQWYAMPGGLTNVTQIAAGGTYTLALGGLLPQVTIQPLSQPVFSGNPVNLEVTASGTPPLQVQWQHDGMDIPGATTSILTLPAAEHQHAGAYRAVIRNDLGETSSAEAVLTVVDAPPVISVRTTPVTAFAGGAAVLSATVEGSLPMSFQWQKDGVAIAGATGASLSLSPVAADAAGNYSVVIRNAFGDQTSATIPVHLLPVAWWGAPASGLMEMPVALTNAVSICVRDWDTPTGVALRSDGGVIAWGHPVVFRVPADLTNAVSISAGGGFGMALRTDGTVAVWGNNTARQTNTPAGLSGVAAISAGWRHCLALKQDGTVTAWGENGNNQARPPLDLRDAVAIGAGFTHSVALKRDGTVVAWGNNVIGQLKVPPGLAQVVAIAAGGDHTLALKSDGSVVAWGNNSHRQAEVPPGLDNVTAIGAADTYSIALRRDGSLTLWGAPGTVTNVPVNLERVQAICLAQRAAYALLGDAAPASFAIPLTPVLAKGVFSASFETERGSAYRFEFTDALSGGNWVLGVPVHGDNAPATLRDATATAPSRFYRIRQWR